MGFLMNLDTNEVFKGYIKDYLEIDIDYFITIIRSNNNLLPWLKQDYFEIIEEVFKE